MGYGTSSFSSNYSKFYRYTIEDDSWEEVESSGHSVTGAFGFSIESVGYYGAGFSNRIPTDDNPDDFQYESKVYRLEPEFLSVKKVSAPAIKLFPNPTTQVIELSDLAPESTLYLYDLVGKLLPISFISDTKINTSHLAPGMYFLSISSSQGSQTLKFVKK